MPARPMTSRPRSRRAFWRDRGGVVAVEFALIASMMLLFYCGMAELTEAMMAERRLSHVSSSIGDIVARDNRLTDARRDDVFQVGGVLMAPFPVTKLRLCLYSVVSDANGKDTVDWVEPHNTPVGCPKTGDGVDIATAVLPASSSVIVSKASYDYESPIKLVMPNAIVFRRTVYLKPRLSETVARIKG